MSATEALQKAIKAAGSAAELARRIGITPQALGQWDVVPPERILAVEAAVDGAVTRHELRPDICGAPPSPVGEVA